MIADNYAAQLEILSLFVAKCIAGRTPAPMGWQVEAPPP